MDRSTPVAWLLVLGACGGSQVGSTGTDAGSGGDASGSTDGPVDGTSSSPEGGTSDVTAPEVGGDTATGPADGSSDSASRVQCGAGATPKFPTFNKYCTTAQDCALVTHLTDCCGDTLVTAISAQLVAEFNMAEATCDAQYPACGCFSDMVTVEDGSKFRGGSGSQPVVAVCELNVCRAKSTQPTFACGDKACLVSGNYCQSYTPADAGTTYACVFTGTAVTCGGFAISAGCTCSMDGGGVFDTCSSACTTCGP
jgi:hypothetical protein